MIAAAGWWIAIVSLWPADSRPYIGGSQDNSILELTLGYNGFGRLTGDETGSVGGGGGNGGGMWGSTGILRLFNTEIGGQVAWLVPAALVLLGAGLWFTRRAPRTDLTRASLIAWGGWLLVTGLTFSFMAGIFHAYYTVALAPAIGAARRHRRLAAVDPPAQRRPPPRRRSDHGPDQRARASSCCSARADFLPWLRWLVLVGGLLTALAADRHRSPAPPARCRRSRRPHWWSASPGPRRTPCRPRRPGTPARSWTPVRAPAAAGAPGAAPAPVASDSAGGAQGTQGAQGNARGTAPGRSDRRPHRRLDRRPAHRQQSTSRDHRAAPGRRLGATAGPLPPSARTPRPATSWPARSR